MTESRNRQWRILAVVLTGSGPGGSSSGSSGSDVTPSLVHSAQSATAVNLCFIAAALLCVLGLPRKLADQAAGQGDGQQPDSQKQPADAPRVARRDAA